MASDTLSAITKKHFSAGPDTSKELEKYSLQITNNYDNVRFVRIE